MRPTARLLTLILAAGGMLAGASTARARQLADGQQVVMHFAEGTEPSYPAGSLNYRAGAYHSQPVVYRTVWRFEEAPESAPVRIRTGPWAFIWVNGRCVHEHQPEQPADAPLEIDLGPHLSAGANVVAISADKNGFALAGWAKVDGRSVPLASEPGDWVLWKFAPLTILEAEPFTSAVELADLKYSPARGGSGRVRCTPDQARRIAARALADRLADELADLDYESKLMVSRGVVMMGARPVLWGGPAALAPEAVAAAGNVSSACPSARQALDRADGGKNLRALDAAAEQIRRLRRTMQAAVELVDQDRRLIYCRLASRALAKLDAGAGPVGLRLPDLRPAARALAEGDAAGAMERLAQADVTLDRAEADVARRLGGPINELDSAVGNKAGWIDDPTLTDAVPAAWGVRFNPIETSWRMDLSGMWRFKLDPGNTGLAERVHEFGYNIANQWPELKVPGTWEKQGARFQVANPQANAQSPFPDVNVRTDGPYNGYAWYRKKILVPAEWAGYDLELYMGAVDDWDWTYWNGRQIGHTDAKTNPDDWWSTSRRYTIPKEQVTFGGYNVIAVQVYDCGAGGGILGGIEIRCPALKQSFAARPRESKPKPKTTVYSGALSPAAVLTVGGKELDMYGWDLRSSAGPEGLVLPLADGVAYRSLEDGSGSATVYDRDTDGKLNANWTVLWATPGRPDGELPIQLVFVDEPTRIVVERGAMGTRQVTVHYDKAGATALALRPIRAPLDVNRPDGSEALERYRFWSSAALAYPLHYAEIARKPADADDRLEVVDVYDYRIYEDAWGTEPTKIAPLPPLASFGLAVNARDLTTDAKPLPMSLGDYGRLHAAVGSDAISYTVPLDTQPRMGGFTSFCFGPDVGVPGNAKEIEIMAYTGCNSWRPQSNERGEEIFQTVDWANGFDMNLTLNIDNTLGAKPEAVEHWVTIGKRLADKPVWAAAYDLINEPANMPPEPYNAQIARIVKALRKVDDKHLLYIETPHSFASIDQFINLAPVDDPMVAYTFHDYDYRLTPRWPTPDTDIRNMLHQWLPAYRYSLEHDAPICISEYGGFEQTPHDPWTNPAALSLLADFFKVFDQFGFHHHYYSNRGIAKVRPDGSIRLSLVHEAYKGLFDGDTFYRYRTNWQEQLKSKE